MRGFAALALILSACSFNPGALPADGGADGPPPITLGFAKATTTADEASGVVPVRVVMSAPSSEVVNVAFSVIGNTASRNTDFTATDGLLTFAPGDVEEVIDITILPDSATEPDETLDVKLSNVSDSNITLGTSTHTLTISANVLPRVSFTSTSSTGAEDASTMIDVMLDAPPAAPVTVNVIASSTTVAVGGGVDFDLSSATVMFAAGETSKQITMNVNNDTLDENDEDAIVTLDSPSGAILATTNTTRTHVIQDNDLPPTVSFAAGASSSLGEAGTMVDLTVSLSTASGKDISVPFAVDGASSATGTADYTLGTASPLSFPAGMTSKTIRVNVVQDTVAEVNETVVLTLGPLDTSFVTAGANTTHTLTIGDDDPVCLGTGAFAACFLTPTNTVNLSGSLDTTNSSLCSATAPTMWTGQPASCFIVAQTINVASALNVTGNKPLVLWASGAINITANIDASSHRGGTSGPGSNSSLCAAYTDNPVNSDGTNGGGGGAGGTFRTAGGNGGDGGIAAASGGSATGAVGVPTVLRGGCVGQNGGTGEGNAGAGVGGAGGGALYLVAGGAMKIDGVAIAANGASGVAAGQRAGGGGGGSGGMIRLTAGSFNILNAPRIMANGGGASSAGDDNQGGNSGNDQNLTTPLVAPTGGANTGGGGAGGSGFAGTTQATSGTTDSGNNGGGGGGGGGGHVESSATLTGAVISTGP